MPTVREIAERAGVSTATVSRVLNNHPSVSDLARQKVMVVANRSPHIPPVGRQQMSNIAFLYTDQVTLDSSFDAAVLQGLYSAVEKLQADVIVMSTLLSRHRDDDFSQLVLQKRIRGALIRTSGSTKRRSRRARTAIYRSARRSGSRRTAPATSAFVWRAIS